MNERSFLIKVGGPAVEQGQIPFMLLSQILRGVQETIYILASAAVEYDFRQRARIPKELQQACELRRVFERQGSYELVAAVAAPQAAGGIEDIGLLCKERYLDILDCLTTGSHPQEMQACLRDILADFGLGAGTRVGCVGWKCYDARLTGDSRHASDLPSYLVDLLRELAGEARLVRNATSLFTDPATGLRVVGLEPEQIAAFEYASIQTSTSTLAVMRELREGVREDELERLLVAMGLPLSCHRMISFGEKARRGLASPGPNRAALGDVFTIGYGVAGALSSRAGFIARGPADVPAACCDFYPKFAGNYFDVVATWYESLRLGVTLGHVFSAVESVRDDALYKLAVNPGHTLHLDEWVHSPFAAGSTVPLVSGMALQMDIIPISKGPFCYVNAEDGVVLADESLRGDIAQKFPACWERMEARRDFMINTLGIRLDESVLPLSNIPGWLPPYAMSLDQVFVRR